jgi:hypothetical protein
MLLKNMKLRRNAAATEQNRRQHQTFVFYVCRKNVCMKKYLWRGKKKVAFEDSWKSQWWKLSIGGEREKEKKK